MEEENTETQEYGTQQEDNCLAANLHTGTILNEEVNQPEETKKIGKNKHTKRCMNKEEDGEYPGVSIQKKGKAQSRRFTPGKMGQETPRKRGG